MENYDYALQDYVSALIGPLSKEMQYWQHSPERERREPTERPAVSREYNEMEVREPDPPQGVRPEHAVRTYVTHRREYGRLFPRRIAGDYAKTLGKAAEFSNAELQKTGSNSRFCVFERNGMLFMNIVQLDRKGKISSERTREITHNDFAKSINDVRDIEGLMVDDMA